MDPLTSFAKKTRSLPEIYPSGMWHSVPKLKPETSQNAKHGMQTPSGPVLNAKDCPAVFTSNLGLFIQHHLVQFSDSEFNLHQAHTMWFEEIIQTQYTNTPLLFQLTFCVYPWIRREPHILGLKSAHGLSYIVDMAKFSSLVFSFLTVLTVVRGHGYVQQITAGSAVYTGYLPYTDPYYKQVFFVARRRYLLFLIISHFTQPTSVYRLFLIASNCSDLLAPANCPRHSWKR